MVLLKCGCPTIDDVLSKIENIEPVCSVCNTSAIIVQPEIIADVCPPCPDNTPKIDVVFHKSGAKETTHTPNNMNFMLTLSMSKLCYKV